MLVFIGKLSQSTLRWVPICHGFSDFSGFLHHFVIANLATSSIRVKMGVSHSHIGRVSTPLSLREKGHVYVTVGTASESWSPHSATTAAAATSFSGKKAGLRGASLNFISISITRNIDWRDCWVLVGRQKGHSHLQWALPKYRWSSKIHVEILLQQMIQFHPSPLGNGFLIDLCTSYAIFHILFHPTFIWSWN